MRWTSDGSNEDIEDRRSGGGGGGGMKLGIGGFLILLLLSFVFKRDLISPFLGQGGGGAATSAPNPARDAAEEPSFKLARFVLNDAQATWTKLLAAQGTQYPHAKLVLFRNPVDSACGLAESAVGPFYCPGDQKVYLDLGFFDELKRRFGAPGEFAQAYVITHEIGHHVQNVLGIEQKVRQLQQRNPRQKNDLSVRMELQADCFAGVWGKSTAERGLLEAGDVESAVRAATAIGDDTLQRQSTGRVMPDSFTHGSSAQRVKWLNRGFETGQLDSCDTFTGTP